MIQTYHDLSSLDEHEIFDITVEQKHILNQLIHFASKNWGECQKWYIDQCHLATKKNSSKTFVDQPWKKLKPSKYSFDYVNDICNTIKCKSQDCSINLHPVY